MFFHNITLIIATKLQINNMKAKLVLINLILGFTGISIEEPFWASMVGVWWFILSLLLLKYADGKGWMGEIVKRYNFNEI